MRSNKLLDKVKETLITHKATMIAVAIAIAVAAAISGGMIHKLAPSKADYNAGMARIDGEMAAMTNHVVGLTDDVEGILALGPLATEDDLGVVRNKTASNAFNISALKARMGVAEDGIKEIREDIANLPSSPPEGYLTGDFGNYTLHAKCGTAGNYTANIHLVFRPMLYSWNIELCAGNGTMGELIAGQRALDDFYIATNITAFTVHPVVGCDGSDCGISEVWWNIGTFELEANTEKVVTIIFSGLDSNYKQGFAYAEVFPVLK